MPRVPIVFKTTHRIRFSDLDLYNHVTTGQYATYYVDHRLQGVRDRIGWDLKTLATLPFMSAYTKAQNDKISTLGVGPLLYISGNLKASAIYEHLWRSPTLGLGQPGIAPNNAVPTDQFTLQLQAKF